MSFHVCLPKMSLLSKNCPFSQGLKLKLVLTETDKQDHRSGPGCRVSCQSHFPNKPTLPALKSPRPTHPTPPLHHVFLHQHIKLTPPTPIYIPCQTPPPASPQLFPRTLAQRDSCFILKFFANLPSTAGDSVDCVINTWRYSCCPQCLISMWS